MADSGDLQPREDERGTDAPGAAPQVAGEAPRYHDGPSGDGMVQVAYAHGTTVSHSWHNSLMNLVAYDKAVGFNVIASAPFQVFCSGPHGLVEGRNLAVKHFLDETDHEWLFWIDTDMGFAPDALDSLLAAADPGERPVVGGLCFALKNTRPDGMGGWHVKPLPTIFGLAKDKEGRIGFVNRSVYAPNTVTQVAGTGSAFILIHRSVLEAVRAKHGDAWYDLICYEDGRNISEDLSFCWRVTDVMAPIFVHTGVKTTHHKQIWVGEDAYEQPETDPVFDRKPSG